ncbi:MAG: acetyl-CoA decarbonylase/synthase complex subunit delta [Deltaproteobacteria bacterium]|nr:acetyl-CoA decarbonylase/synthase complex subunit delta [Deltaproteobacteria bacterium]MBW2047809.1 acetyl-CoA decarbonylase/synthase complex subunit delta [Deltaproteobacteria bacterium]MBW2352382.1 acetyl-CoA decarbonylase/synthase complex subunit delta [Deltaproteobacteria bacterium]HDZ91647.1 acetyl-CoA decarbonylase/synthase complex subunit delta [Deltaproteobacteria bacterium]
MAFEIPEQPYSGKIGETEIGAGSSAIKLGGEESYPFHLFEGSMPNPPRIAMEVWDYDPSEEWPAAAVEPFKDVIASPEAWAKKCVNEYGADIIVLQLKSTDPNGMDRGADEAAEVAKKVSDAIDVPLVVWGTANNQKDEEVLKKISELCEGKNVGLGPVEEANHKGVGASALGYGHTIVASSPIDVNLAKQLNILLGNLGVGSEKILIDPTTGGLGYGLEYSYSVMERIKMAALTQEDDKLQVPMINNLGNEIWKCKEAGESIEEGPTLGDPERRAILMECTAAVAYLLGGSNAVILRHPESVRLTRAFIDLMIKGGAASDVEEISKNLEPEEADLLSISPEPDLDLGEAAAEKKPAAKEKAAPEKKAAKKPKAAPKEVKKEAKKAEAKPEAKEAVKSEAEKEAEAKAKAEAEAKAKAEAEEKARAEAEARAKAEEEAKAKAEAEAKAKAEAEEKARAEAEARAKAEKVARREAEEEKIREKRAKEKEKREALRAAKEVEEVSMTPAKVQKGMLEKMVEQLDRIHKRNLKS